MIVPFATKRKLKLILINQLVFNTLVTLKKQIKIMTDPCILFRSQYKKAKETLDFLEKQKYKIELDLESNPISADLNKKLREINLDIKITSNELEHANYSIDKCETKHDAIKKNI